MMFTLPWTRFQTWGTGDKTRFETPVVNTALAAGLLALAVASFVLGVARASAKVLAIQRTLARVLSVVYACNGSGLIFFDVQIQFLTLPTFPLALPRTAAHRLITELGAVNGGRVLVTGNSFRMFAVRELLLDHLLTINGFQVLEQVAVHDESSHQCHQKKEFPTHTMGLAPLHDRRVASR
jgi:hypothetical protein